MTSATDTVHEAQFKLRELARPMCSDTREASLHRVARVVGLSISQAQRIVYAKCKRIDAHVLDNIRANYAALEAKAERMADDMEAIARSKLQKIEADNAVDIEPDENVSGVGRKLAAGGSGQDQYPNQEND